MNEVILFDNNEIRRVWHEAEKQWYFAVPDVIGVLTESKDAKAYWRQLKRREPQIVTVCHDLKIPSSDGKSYKTSCANKEGLFRIIQSVPSKKAEPFKLWLAKVGSQHVDEKVNKRLTAFNKLKQTQGKFKETAKGRGVDDQGFKRVLEAGDEVLFNTRDLKEKFGISEDEDADTKMHEILLKGKDYFTSISDFNVNKEDVEGEENIKEVHKQSNKWLRESIKEGIGRNPEEIPPQENIKKLKK
ncbi:BRO family protein [Flexithrix dorotheae]|uniref:BRO family protein n=1 Tax=Flexithrix dorotheae TaxID=70993 RepID=UPI00036E3FFC|nr:BRO family protein [Flexithrix dorotheae]